MEQKGGFLSARRPATLPGRQRGASEGSLPVAMSGPDRRIQVVEILEAAAGGTRTHLLQLLNGLDTDRFRLTLIVSTERDRRFRDDIPPLRAAGVRIIEVPMVRQVAPFRDLVSLLRLIAAFRAIGPDIVHTHSSKAGALGRMAAYLCGIRNVVHTPHVYFFQDKAGLSRRLYLTIDRMLQPLARRVVLLSDSQRRLVTDEIGADGEQLVVIENGVDADHFRSEGQRREAGDRLGIPPGAAVVGTISRFRPQKACDVLVRSLAIVFERVPDAHCIFVATGPQRGEIMSLARQLGVRDRIIWRDHVADTRGIYEAMDVFAVSSVYEGMPYTILEAMSMGVPVVTTNISGCRELVRHERTGLLVEPGDPPDLARSILRILEDKNLARKMGAEARRVVEREFNVERFIRKTEALYAELAGRRA